MIPFIPVLILLLVVLGCALYALVSEYLENRNILSQDFSSNQKTAPLPDPSEWYCCSTR